MNGKGASLLDGYWMFEADNKYGWVKVVEIVGSLAYGYYLVRVRENSMKASYSLRVLHMEDFKGKDLFRDRVEAEETLEMILRSVRPFDRRQ